MEEIKLTEQDLNCKEKNFLWKFQSCPCFMQNGLACSKLVIHICITKNVMFLTNQRINNLLIFVLVNTIKILYLAQSRGFHLPRVVQPDKDSKKWKKSCICTGIFLIYWLFEIKISALWKITTLSISWDAFKKHFNHRSLLKSEARANTRAKLHKGSGKRGQQNILSVTFSFSSHLIRSYDRQTKFLIYGNNGNKLLLAKCQVGAL